MLSPMLSSDSKAGPKFPSTILPTFCVIRADTWGIEKKVRHTLEQVTVPQDGPTNRVFVLSSLHSQIIHWAHTFNITGHPGIHQTMFLIQQHFWWPAMEREVGEYVTACPVCARRKSSHCHPPGLLQLLPVPQRPSSDIALDFVMGFPPSQGNTAVLTVVDRFTKMFHFIPVPKLPSANKTAEVMMHHVFHLHGFPRDVVSDQGPQLIS